MTFSLGWKFRCLQCVIAVLQNRWASKSLLYALRDIFGCSTPLFFRGVSIRIYVLCSVWYIVVLIDFAKQTMSLLSRLQKRPDRISVKPLCENMSLMLFCSRLELLHHYEHEESWEEAESEEHWPYDPQWNVAPKEATYRNEHVSDSGSNEPATHST